MNLAELHLKRRRTIPAWFFPKSSTSPHRAIRRFPRIAPLEGNDSA
jgi:hypothetical protein